MRWLLMLMLSLMMIGGTSCVFSEDDGTPDTTIVEDNDPPASNTTIIDTDPPAADTDVDVNLDTTP